MAEIDTFGIPDIRPLQIVALRGLGKLYSGTYFVEGVRLIFDTDSKGFSTTLFLRKPGFDEAAKVVTRATAVLTNRLSTDHAVQEPEAEENPGGTVKIAEELD